MQRYVDGLYAWPFDGNLKPENTAILVIDMQIDFCAEGGWVHSRGVNLANTRRPIAPLQKLLPALRAAGYTVIYTREGHKPDLSDLPANKRWRSRQLTGKGLGDMGPLGRFLTRGEPNWDVIPELAPEEGDLMIDKPGKGSFVNTDLDEVLQRRGIRNLMVCGVTTDCCVQSTMRDANDRGYECVMLEDCCGCADHQNHIDQVEMMKIMGGHYGSVCSSLDVLKMLEA